MARKSALKRAIYRTPLPGWQFIFWGTLAMLAWAVWEFTVRWDAMDGMTKVFFGLVEDGTITLKNALERIWDEPKARADWINLIYLAACALFALIAHFVKRRFAPCFIIIPGCVMIAYYRIDGSAIASMLNLFTIIRCGAACLIALGASLNIITYYKRRAAYNRRIKQKRAERLSTEAKRRRLLDSRASSLLPKRAIDRNDRG